MEVEVESLPQAAGLGSYDSIDRRVVVLGASEDGGSDLLFIDFAGASAQGEITDANQKTREALTLCKRRGFNDPLHQFTFCFDGDIFG